MESLEQRLIKYATWGVFFGISYWIQDLIRKRKRKKSINFKEIDENKNQTYYQNGVLESQGILINNLKDGKWKYFNEDGILIKEEEYHNGILLKEYVYNESNIIKQSIYNKGVLSSEGMLINNNKNGVWKIFNEEECLIKEEIYEDGNLKETIEYEYPDNFEQS